MRATRIIVASSNLAKARSGRIGETSTDSPSGVGVMKSMPLRLLHRSTVSGVGGR
jgi:hypothetical protein